MKSGLNPSCRLRATPYQDRIEAAGVSGFSVVNHMLLPKAYRSSLEQDYWHLRKHVQIWDVSCQRQIRICGEDAARLLQWMTPRNIASAQRGDCLYIPLVDACGGIINDPILLKHEEDCFWLSIADSDVLLYAMGLAIGAGLQVRIDEADIAPLAIQGPKAEDLMVSVFGEAIRDLGFFKHAAFDFCATQQIISRSGYSRQGGFEIYLEGSALAPILWDRLWEAGRCFNLAPGSPNLIERIEGGLLSYGNEMTRANNPLEMGLAKFCDLDGSVDCIGLAALQEIARKGVERIIRGVAFGGVACPPCAKPWPVKMGDRRIGQITSAAWSPRLQTNVGLGLIDCDDGLIGEEVVVIAQDGLVHEGRISGLPFD